MIQKEQSTMKAYRWLSKGKGLVLQDVHIPSPSPSQVLVKVEAAGICHTDLHIVAGMGWQPDQAITMGHEVSGTIKAIGSNVSQYQYGDRVVVACPGPYPERVPAIGLHYDGVIMSPSRVLGRF